MTSTSTPSVPKARPMIFSAPMVRAILAGRKSQTRRVVTPQPHGVTGGVPWLRAVITKLDLTTNKLYETDKSEHGHQLCKRMRCAHGVPGDLVWVREAWDVCCLARDPSGEAVSQSIDWRSADGMIRFEGVQSGRWHLVYSADGQDSHNGRWRSPIHMPRWASRLTLRITAVRVERVQSITDRDIAAEGINYVELSDHQEREVARLRCVQQYRGRPDLVNDMTFATRCQFRVLWNSMNGARGHGWDTNPWVWVYEFERVPQPSGEEPGGAA